LKRRRAIASSRDVAGHRHMGRGATGVALTTMSLISSLVGTEVEAGGGIGTDSRDTSGTGSWVAGAVSSIADAVTSTEFAVSSIVGTSSAGEGDVVGSSIIGAGSSTIVGTSSAGEGVSTVDAGASIAGALIAGAGVSTAGPEVSTSGAGASTAGVSTFGGLAKIFIIFS